MDEQLYLFDVGPKKKPPFQYSLKRLFVIVTLASVFFAIFHRPLTYLVAYTEYWFQWKLIYVPIIAPIGWLFGYDFEFPSPNPGSGGLDIISFMIGAFLSLVIHVAAIIFSCIGIEKLWKWSSLPKEEEDE